MYKKFAADFMFNNPFPDTGDGTTSFQSVISITLRILGVVSVIVIIYAGIRLSLARGNPDAIGKLRSTLIYAAIGLFVAIGAIGIIEFVLRSV